MEANTELQDKLRRWHENEDYCDVRVYRTNLANLLHTKRRRIYKEE